MFHNSPSAPDTALPEHAPVTSAETHTALVQNPIVMPSSTAGNTVVDLGNTAIDLADVEITELSPTEWRVADHAIEHDDPTALLGFIQIVGSAFEVTNLGRPRERAYFTSFDRATASLLTRGVLA